MASRWSGLEPRELFWILLAGCCFGLELREAFRTLLAGSWFGLELREPLWTLLAGTISQRILESGVFIFNKSLQSGFSMSYRIPWSGAVFPIECLSLGLYFLDNA